jgi:hypothetical protein
MATWEQDLLASLEELGEAEVKSKISEYGTPGSDRRLVVERWLADKREEQTLSIAREANSISREANSIARDARRSATKANIIAIIAMILSAAATISAVILGVHFKKIELRNIENRTLPSPLCSAS